MDITGRIHSVESFGTVDGPGIRLVVFMQGCCMRCLYCHNPDTWATDSGKEVTTDYIIKQYEKGKAFYRNGGITVTGGEPLLQIDFVTELFKKAKALNIHTCLDTSGITFDRGNADIFRQLTGVTDLVMLDIKHIDDECHRKLTGHSNRNILEFAEFLDENKVAVWIRHVVVPNITLDEKYLYRLGEFIGRLNNVKALDVLPYHTLGREKYKKLGICYPLENTEAATKEQAHYAKEVILKGMQAYRSNN